MMARIIPALMLGVIVTTFSSNIVTTDTVKLKKIDSVSPVFIVEENTEILDSIAQLVQIVDSVAIKTKVNVEKINKNNKILKNYEMATDTAKNS